MLVVFAAANRDPALWPDPDRFDVARANVRRHLGFGHGVHTCMGLHLARREMVNLMEAMRARVARWHLDGKAQVAMNNSIRAFAHLPVRVEPG